MKKNKIIIFIVLLFLMIGSFAIYFFIVQSYPFFKDKNIKIINTLDLVDVTDQTCEIDDDCVLAMVECSCDCGIPINKIYWQKYLDAQEEKCRNYEGPYCKISCVVESECINKICRLN